MGKKTKWKWMGSNIMDMRSEEEKAKYRKKMFKWGLQLQKMKVNKPSLDGDKPFYENEKKKKKTA